MTPKEISSMLAKDVNALAMKFLPNGKRVGHHWVCGSIRGETGDSFKLNLSGSKQGFWFDFATGEFGDCIDLWRICSSRSMAETLIDIRKHLGIVDHSWKKQNNFKPPVVPKCHVPKNRVKEFLYSRGLTQQTIEVFKIGEYSEAGKDYVIFPFLFEGKARMIKRRNIDDKKDIRPTSSDQEKCLFGWQSIPEDSRTVVICEGEIDAMSFYQFGIPALSVPFGGGSGNKQDWVENEYENLNRFDEIILCMDMDDAGKAANFELIKRLGNDRCRVATLPLKDANECLQAKYDFQAMREIITQAQAIDPSELRKAKIYEEGVYKLLDHSGGYEDCFFMPWAKMRDQFQFRFSEYTVLNGINGHGKSQGAGHIILGALSQGERCCIASMELKPERLLARLTRQASALTDGVPTRDFVSSIFNWYGENLWIFECVGTAKADRIIEVFTYARKRYGIRVFLIDSLLKCGFGEDDYNGQKAFCEKICDFKNDYGCHVLLVTHSKKKRDEEEEINKFDVRGSGSITDLADNVINWMRNKKKERLLSKPDIEDVSQIEGLPDAFVVVEKQRNGDWEGRFNLWFDKNSYQFKAEQNSPLTQYVKYSNSRAG